MLPLEKAAKLPSLPTDFSVKASQQELSGVTHAHLSGFDGGWIHCTFQETLVITCILQDILIIRVEQQVGPGTLQGFYVVTNWGATQQGSGGHRGLTQSPGGDSAGREAQPELPISWSGSPALHRALLMPLGLNPSTARQLRHRDKAFLPSCTDQMVSKWLQLDGQDVDTVQHQTASHLCSISLGPGGFTHHSNLCLGRGIKKPVHHT